MSRLVRGADLLHYPEPTWLLDGWIPDDSIGFLYGPPSVGKSWVAMDIALRFAVSGHTVLYVAAERERILIDRARTWASQHHLPHPPDQFVVLTGNPQLASPTGWREICDAVTETQPTVIIFDTLAQVTVGLKENDGADMGRVVGRLDELRRNMIGQSGSGTVLTVHHEGKDRGRGMRGHSSLKGRADYEIEVSRRGDLIVLTVTKLNAGTEPAPKAYRLEHGVLVEVGPTVADMSPKAVEVFSWVDANGGSAAPADIVRALGWDAKTVRAAASQHPRLYHNGEQGRRARWVVMPEPETV